MLAGMVATATHTEGPAGQSAPRAFGGPDRPAPAGKMARVRNVEVFAVGQHKGKTYTEQDLQDMVDNFHRFKGMLDPSAVIGHEEEAEGGQPLVEDEDGRPDPDLTAGIDNSGTPAVGWIADLRKRGPSLYADIEGVPPSIAKLINGRAYKKVSAEVYDHPEAAGLKGTGKVFRRVALLGGELPQIKRLSDLPLAEYGEYTPRDRYRRAAARFSRVVLKFSEIKTPSRRAPAGIHTCFFEVTKHMDRQAMLDFLAGQGVDISQITEAVPDEALMEIVKAWQSQASQDVNGDQAADHADHPRGDDDDGDDDNCPPENRFDQDPGEKAMWAKVDESGTVRKAGGRYSPKRMAKKGWPPSKPKKNADGFDETDPAMDNTAAMADGTGVGNNTPQTNCEPGRGQMGEGPKQDQPLTDGGPVATAAAPVTAAIHPQTPPRHPEQVVIKYSEDLKALRAQHAALEAQIKGLTKFAEERTQADKRALIKTRLENLVTQGKVLPAQRERLEGILFAADSGTVMKFSEGGKEVQGTMLDRLFAMLEAGPNLVKFAEQVRQPDAAKVSADRKQELLAATPMGRHILAQRAGK